MSPSFHHGNTQGTLFRLTWLWDVDPAHRLWFDAFPVFWVETFNRVKSLFRGDGFDAVPSGCFLALVVLGDLPHCQESGCPRLHQKLLEFVDCLLIAILLCLKVALLCPLRLLSTLTPGLLRATF